MACSRVHLHVEHSTYTTHATLHCLTFLAAGNIQAVTGDSLHRSGIVDLQAQNTATASGHSAELDDLIDRVISSRPTEHDNSNR